jgi:uncharacterized protein YpmS
LSQDDLMLALDFTAEDLEANRKGRLSEKQRLSLGSRSWKTSLGYSVLSLIFAVFAILPALRLVRVDPAFRDQGDVLLMVFFASLAAIPAGLAFMRWRKIMTDTVGGTVNSVRGVVSTNVKQASRGNVRYILKVQNVEFQVSKAAMQAFTNHAPYIVYFAPITLSVLAAEPAAVR